MKYIISTICIILLLFSCKNEEEKKENNFISKEIKEVIIEESLTDSTLNVRAFQIFEDGTLTFAGANNTYGMLEPNGERWLFSKQDYDSLKLEFRAVGKTTLDFFMMSVGSPALVFKTGDSGKMELVYKEDHEKAFYDSMIFWNDQEGIAIGDPTDDCMSVIITRDGGETWTKLSCETLPKAKEGEAAFAASDTNIAVVGDNTWVATGGKASRILFSPDKGKTWEVFETPMVQGLETTGMYSIDFYNKTHGFAIGGDYTKPDDNAANKIRTTDGGRTWELVAENQNPGYRSCVQYVPNSQAKALVAVGFKGIDYSNDSGNTWKHLSDEGYYTIRFLNDSIAYAAGNGRISKLVFKTSHL